MSLSFNVEAVISRLEAMPYANMPVELRRAAYQRDPSAHTSFDLLARLAMSGMPLELSRLALAVVLHYGVQQWHILPASK